MLTPRGVSQTCLRAATAIAGVALLAVPGYAQPSNNNCASPQALTVGTPFSGNTQQATGDGFTSCAAGDPPSFFLPGSGKDVWFTVTAPNTGVLAVSTAGTGFSVVVSAYTGSCGSLAELGCASTSFASQPLVFDAAAGQSYAIRLAGLDHGGGPESGAYSILVESHSPPTNNACVSAIALPLNTPLSGDTIGATTDGASTCPDFGSSGKDVWYAVTPNTSGALVVTMTNTDPAFAVILSLHAGSCGSLSEVICQSNAPGQPLTAAVVAGQTYHFRIAGSDFGNGASFGAYTVTAQVLTPPANDACAAAAPLGVNDSKSGNNLAAGTDGTSTCPDFGTSGKDVWYAMTPAAPGVVEITASFDSVFSTGVVSVYSGSCGSLTQIACVTTEFGAKPILLEVAPGQTYRVRFAGADLGLGVSAGTFTLSTQYFAPPTNDDCASATPIAENDYLFANNHGARTQLDPVVYGCPEAASTGGPSTGTQDIWFKFVPTVTKHYQISTCDSQIKTVTHIFSSADGTCNALSQVTCDARNYDFCNSSSRGSPDAVLTAGTTYYIRVASDPNGIGNPEPIAGDIVVTIFEWVAPTGGCCLPNFAGCSAMSQSDCLAASGTYHGNFTVCDDVACPIPNDNCEMASTRPLMLNTPLMENVAGATTDGSAACDAANSSPNDIDAWYTFTPPSSGLYNITTCGTTGVFGVGTALSVAVYDNCSHKHDAELACSGYDALGACIGPIVTSTELNVQLTGGQTYLVRVGGLGGNVNVLLTATLAAPPQGACCINNGATCTMKTEIACGSAGGKWGGPFITCGNCTIAPGNACVNALPLVVNAAATAASFNNATRTGMADCAGSYPDSDLWFSFNATLGAAYHVQTNASGSVAAFSTCGPTRQDLICGQGSIDLTSPVNGQLLLWVAHGQFAGPDVTVEVDQLAGACCHGTSCTVVSQSACQSGGGSFQGNGSACGPVGNPTTCCPANHDGLGGVDVADLFGFINHWLAKNASADFNHDTAIDVADLFGYINAWLAKC